MRQIDKDDSKPLGAPIRKPTTPQPEPSWKPTEDGKYETRTVDGKQEVRSVEYQKKQLPWDAGWPHFPHGPLISGVEDEVQAYAAFLVGLHSGE